MSDLPEHNPLEPLSDELAITALEFRDIQAEIEEQPNWRANADVEMDYVDGNQLSEELRRRQEEVGLPPAIENLIGPALRSIQGYEAMTRTDWRVTPNGEVGGQDVADALNYKLNQAERNSKADKACSDAFASQIACGIGWVEVARNSDRTQYPFKCRPIHRNEIHWDMSATEKDLSDARWLMRSKWLSPHRAALSFPEHKDLILGIGRDGPDAMYYHDLIRDGGTSTALQNSHGTRASTISEQRWYNQHNRQVCVFELWYRRWESVPVIETPDGRIVEYDESNPMHVTAVAMGYVTPELNTVTRIRRSYWLGPHLLNDAESPYSHKHFPYVPFWGFREDNSGIPYGYVRDMKYPQDSLNSGISKLRWGMSTTRIERTEGAVDMTDDQLRAQAARPDADIVLNAQAMARAGARFEIIRDYTLTDQHYQMLRENRESIDRTSNITQSFKGRSGAQSGYQEQIQVEQSNQSLADVMDNFREARTQVGEILLAMIIADLGDKEQAVVVAGDALTEDKHITINKREIDPQTGTAYLSNDIERTRLMVALEDVPQSSSFRAQQLGALSEVAKALPPELQAVVVPYMMSLMDVPYKDRLIKEIKEAQSLPTQAQIDAQIEQAVQDALAKAANDIKLREIELKERKAESEIKEIDARSVQVGVQAAYAAMQGGAQIAQMPQIAPIADAVMQGAGYQRPNPIGDDPNFPTANMPAEPLPDDMAGELPDGVQQNTSPAYPPVPQDASSPMQGIETPRVSDNLPQ